MTPATFCEHFATFAEAPNGVVKLRELILQLAVQGKLVPQDVNDEPATVILELAQEAASPTHHQKIMIAKVREYDLKFFEKDIDELIDLFKLQNNEAIVRKMKEMLPEYISANSEYEKLDNALKIEE